MRLNHHPPRGFRFFATDAIAMIVCAGMSWWAYPLLGTLAWLFPFVLGHFFLFCNVFRVPRRLELIWAASFVVNFVVVALVLQFGWLVIGCVQLPITLTILALTIRHPRYRGVFCEPES